jgi:uncharacterized membrane protein
MEFDLNRFVKRYNNREFLLLFIFIFFVLSILLAFVKFVSQWPVLIIISFVVAFIIYNHFSESPDPNYVETQKIYQNMVEKSDPKNGIQTILKNSILLNNDNRVDQS